MHRTASVPSSASVWRASKIMMAIECSHEARPVDFQASSYMADCWSSEAHSFCTSRILDQGLLSCSTRRGAHGVGTSISYVWPWSLVTNVLVVFSCRLSLEKVPVSGRCHQTVLSSDQRGRVDPFLGYRDCC